MVAVLLTILKILGITLLVLFGIILAVALLILFVPIRYKIKVHRKIEDETPIVADVRVTYLMHIINAAFSYPEAAYVRVRALCFTIFRSDKQKSNTKKSSSDSEKDMAEEGVQHKKKKETEKPLEASKENAELGKLSGEENSNEENADKTKTSQTKPSRMDSLQEDNIKEESINTEEEEDKSEKEKNRIFEFFHKIWFVLENIRYTIGRICDKIKDIVNNTRYYVEILKSERFNRGFKVCKEQLHALFKMLRPQKMTGELLIGTGDPASTGQVMAVYGILYPLVGNHIEVTPDFERQIVEGALFVKGRITIFKLLKCAWILYFNKDIRELIKLFKREAV